MEFVKNITIELSDNDVKEIIALYIRESLPYDGVEAKDVTIKVANECRGYGMDEHQEACFKGASVICKIG